MKLMVMVKASAGSEAGEMPNERLLKAMGDYNEELVKAGILLAGEGLHPSSKGFRIRFSGSERTVVDGPFAQTNELVAGYWMWQVKSMEEALEWAKRCPNPMNDDSEIEIRRVYGPEDFGEAYTPEIREQEERIGAQAAEYALEDPRFEVGRERKIAGLEETYGFDERSGIPAQWERFVPSISGIEGRLGEETYGVCSPDEEGKGFSYLAGVEVKDSSSPGAGLSCVVLPAHRYAIFSHSGHVSTLCKTCDAIWKAWLPNSSHKAARAPFFERYTEAFDPATKTGGIEIWIPLES